MILGTWQKVKKIIFGALKNIGAFLVGGVLGILSVIIFAKPLLEATVKKDVGLGIIAVAPAIILIYGILFATGGGVLGVIVYNFANIVLRKKKVKTLLIKKRIFIALAVSDNLTNKINEWRVKNEDLPVKWVADKNLHMTLIPPFYADNAEVEIAKEKLKQFENSIGEIEIVFDNIDLWPDAENPLLIRAIGKTPEKIEKLKENLEKIYNYKSEYQPFLLHITIAKFNKKDLKDFQVKKINGNVLWKGRAESLVLMESKLSDQGADYEILEEVEL